MLASAIVDLAMGERVFAPRSNLSIGGRYPESGAGRRRERRTEQTGANQEARTCSASAELPNAPAEKQGGTGLLLLCSRLLLRAPASCSTPVRCFSRGAPSRRRSRRFGPAPPEAPVHRAELGPRDTGAARGAQPRPRPPDQHGVGIGPAHGDRSDHDASRDARGATGVLGHTRLRSARHRPRRPPPTLPPDASVVLDLRQGARLSSEWVPAIWSGVSRTGQFRPAVGRSKHKLKRDVRQHPNARFSRSPDRIARKS